MTLKGLFRRANYANEQRAWLQGRLGRLSADGTSTIFAVPYRDKWVWVRMGPNGDQGIMAAYNKGGVPYRAGLPVRMKRDNGVLTIYETDTTLLTSDPHAPVAPGGVPIHHHRSVAGPTDAANPLSYVHEAKQFERGRVYSAGGMSVTIAPFRYWHNGTWETWEGGNLDLTAYKPGTSGHHAWVLVGINPATNTAVAVAGSSVVYATSLAYADLDAIAFGEYIPCAAVRVRNDDTALTDVTRYIDAHGWYGDGSRTFTGLTDTPGAYTGAAGKLVQANAGETAVEFVELGSKIAAAIEKATPIDADNLALADSAASNVLKRLSWANLKATLKTYFDTVYGAIANVVLRDGTQTLTGDWDIGSGRKILGDKLTARSASGLSLEDDGGNVGVFVEDGGNVGVGHADPNYLLHVKKAAPVVVIQDTEANAANAAAWLYLSESSSSGGLQGRLQVGYLARKAVLQLVKDSDGSTVDSAHFTEDGRAGFGVTAPSAPLHVVNAVSQTYSAILQGVRTGALLLYEMINAAAASTAAGVSLAWRMSTSAQTRSALDITATFDATTDATRNSLVEIKTAIAGTFGTAMAMTGKTLGLFNAAASPQGILHAHNGVGGLIFVTKSGVDATAQTILPNAAGDVTHGLSGLSVVTDGATAAAGPFSLNPGASLDIGAGTLTVRLTCAADGSLTVKRQSGTGTATVALLAVWL